MKSFDVIVIGAGVAGSSAAYELANAGLRVLVLEKEKLPRYKTCGGGVVIRSAKLFPFPLGPVLQKKFLSVNVIDHENKIHFGIARKQPFIYMVMREEFDYFILSKAVEKGAVVYDRSGVTGIESLPNHVEVETRENSFKADYVIGCDGATGFTMTRFKLSKNIIRVPAVESELCIETEFLKSLGEAVRFDFGLVPHGYGWVFPKKGHLSIGVAFMKKVDQSIQIWFKKYLDLLGLNSKIVLKEEKHGYVIPLVHRKVSCHSGRILFAGDNLGLADPLTAEGISYAIETGQLAARTLLGSNLNYSGAIQNYKAGIDNLHREIKAARFLSKVVYGPPALRKFVFKHWGNRLSELLTDVITGEKSYSEMVRNPVNYAKLFRPSFLFNKSGRSL